MNLLGLDTSSVACSVGVLSGERLVTRHEERPREHTTLLMPMIRSALAEAELAVSDIHAIILGNGPGSFIGVRIAGSVAQGLAFGLGLNVVPVSSMAAVAAAAGRPGQTVAVAQDAHMQQVYFGMYRIGSDGTPETIVAERLQAQQRLPDLESCADAIAAGAGWERYPSLLEQNRDRFSAVSRVLYPQAGAILKIGAAGFRAGAAIPPHRIAPAYVRETVARVPGQENS